MALRRISQLDPVLHPTENDDPQRESSLENVVIKPDDPSFTLDEQIKWFVKNNPLLAGYLMEVSEWNGISANAPSYYLSKQFDLSSLISIISASITGSLDDMTTFQNHENGTGEGKPWLLTSLSTNTMFRDTRHHGLNTFENNVYFHHNVTITGEGDYPRDNNLSGDMTTSKESKTGISSVFEVQVPSRFLYPINACAMSAWWADLAEVYDADRSYAPGTLVQFGGEREITIATTHANAVVTTNPGFILNADSHYSCPVGIALMGRTPVLASGKVEKFAKIVLDKDKPGIGRQMTEDDAANDVIAVALESSDDPGVKPIMCSTKFTF